MKVIKLVKEYESKIKDMDTLIETATNTIRDLRRKDFGTKEYLAETEPYVSERRIYEAKRQAYVQFIADLESID